MSIDQSDLFQEIQSAVDVIDSQSANGVAEEQPTAEPSQIVDNIESLCMNCQKNVWRKNRFGDIKVKIGNNSTVTDQNTLFSGGYPDVF